MRRSTTLVVTLVAVMVAIGVPILAAIEIASREAAKAEVTRVLGYAREVLNRSEATANQVEEGIRLLAAVAAPDPCSARSVALMRRIDLASSYIQAIGHVVGDSIVCSSLGTEPGELDIGPVDLVQPTGVKLRTNVVFPFAKGVTFIVVERDGFAAIIHKNLPLEVANQVQDASLAILSTSGPEILAGRGTLKPEWLNALKVRDEVTFVDDTHFVAIVASQNRDLAALAAELTTNVKQHTTAMVATLLPIGLLAAAVLAAVVLYLARSQLSMPAMIRTALRRSEFFIVYQPIVELATGRWVGAEALIRWRRPGGEMVRPDLFIPSAEEAGLIRRITERVVELVGKEAGGLLALNPDAYISLNLSSADLHSKATTDLLVRLAHRMKAKPGNLVVEATERSLTNPALAGDVIGALHARGFRIAMDDFGTGYSNLASLEALKLDYLKIDKSFVDNVGKGAATSYVILHIIEMAKSLKLEMVAEGVETEAQADFLRQHGVEYAQGFYFARPMPMPELLGRQ